MASDEGLEGEQRRRAEDSPTLDVDSLRSQMIRLTISRGDLARLVERPNYWRVGIVGAGVGLAVALAVSAVVGLYVKSAVTGVVRRDVGAATIQNCDHTKAEARVLRRFLLTDALYAGKLGRLDHSEKLLDHDLAVQIEGLGRAIPSRIARDYQRQSDIFQRIAVLRRKTADLWVGRGGHGTRSLAGRALVATRPRCDKIIVSSGG